MRPLERLAGLETEYAIRFRPSSAETPPSKFRLYQALILSLRQQLLVVPARHFKEGVFTATGGAVWFESERPAAGAGLIEGATPECRGPRQLVCHQRAQDARLGAAARSAAVDGQFSLLKNDRDCRGNVYGAQENYQVTLAIGWQLLVWRVGLIMLLPLLAITWVGFLAMIAVMLTYMAIAGLLYLPLQLFVPQPRALAMALFGGDLVSGCETGHPLPAWMESLLLTATRILTAPLASALLLLSWLVAFRHVRRELTSLLVSRAVVSGAGMLDDEGNFHLADKGPAINCQIGFGGFLKDRPMYTMGHFFKAVCIEACFAPGDFLDMFDPQQRLQIALGDSNMSETAEFLRVGSTMLVLDAIEAGALQQAPVLRNPIKALHKICADPTLQATVELMDGRQCTALELQQYYWDACRRYVDELPFTSDEAEEVLQRWDEALEGLQQYRDSGVVTQSMIGSIDWMTKKYLLDEAGAGASAAALKKIDLRYHELAPEGYFQLLERSGLTSCLVDPDDLERAMRTPPSNTPATSRGHYIREFASDTEYFAVNWKRVVIGRGWRPKTIRLSNYGQARRLGRPKRKRRLRA